MVSSNVQRSRRVRASFLVVSVTVLASIVQPACGSEDGKKKAGPSYPGSEDGGAGGDSGKPGLAGSGTTGGTLNGDGGSDVGGSDVGGSGVGGGGSEPVAGAAGGAGAAGAAGGSSGPQCEPGTADCDDNPDDCEQDITLLTSCGACDVTCQSVNGTTICGDTGCEVTTCTANFGDCNGTGTDGCETPLDTADNCGICDRSCGAAACSNGLCGSSPLGSAVAAYRWNLTSDALYRLSGNSQNYGLPTNYTLTRSPLDGGAEVVMATDNQSPGGLTTDETYVYWAVQGTPPAVYRKAHSAAAAVAPTPIFEPTSVPVQLRIRGTAMYWTSLDGAIYSRAMSAPYDDHGSLIVAAAEVKGAGTFNLHQDFVTTPTALYWVVLPAAGNMAFIRTSPLGGGTASDVTGAYMTAFQRLWTVGEDVYWPRATGAATDGAYHYAKGGSVGAPLVVQANLVSVMTDGDYLYMIGSGSDLYRAPIAGGTSVKIGAGTGLGVFPELVGADATRLFTIGAFTKGNGFAPGVTARSFPK